mgnify:CR=1 FL=1
MRPCPEGFGLPVSKCQGCDAWSSEWIKVQNMSELQSVARHRAVQGKIDEPSRGLPGRRVFLYRGGLDECYKVGSVDHTASFFGGFGAAVHFVNSTIPSLHAIPTMSTGTPCGLEGNYTEAWPHALEACGYDGAANALAHIYGKPTGTRSAFDPTLLRYFDQRDFDGPEVGLDPRGGFVYVPRVCEAASSIKTGACGLHVFIHGCGQGAVAGPSGRAYLFNDTYARRAGFNEWAEAHRLVLLYPQLNFGDRAKGDAQAGMCWDQVGQSGDDFSDKSGRQLSSVWAMVQRLLSASD